MIPTGIAPGPQAPLYAMHWLASDKLRKLVATKDLTCGHVGLLWFLVDHMDKNGHAWVTAYSLALTLNRDDAATSREIKKLLDHQLIVRAKDRRTGQAGFMVNPYVASIGKIEDRRKLWGIFKEYLVVKNKAGEVIADKLKADTIGAEVDVERERLQAVAA